MFLVTDWFVIPDKMTQISYIQCDPSSTVFETRRLAFDWSNNSDIKYATA